MFDKSWALSDIVKLVKFQIGSYSCLPPAFPALAFLLCVYKIATRLLLGRIRTGMAKLT